MLHVNNIEVSYGTIHAIHDVSIRVNKGEIVSLIGANGAGKTTILSTVSGLKHPDIGEVILKGNNIAKTEPYKIVAMGMSHVPEGRRIFSRLTVQENLEMGAYIIKNKATLKENMEMVFKMFPRLEERRKQAAGTLSGGEQQMLAIGRALMCNPEFLLMDEPSMGLAPLLVKEIFETIVSLNKQGMTILLVEQNAKMALSVANRAYVLETGRIILEGEGKELLNNEKVKKAYLGA
jgi:ABC-type branched-chain amino acid transport systems, ATPase component